MTYAMAPVRRRVPVWAWILLAVLLAVAVGAGVFVALSLSGSSSPGAPPAAADIARQAGCGPLTADPTLELYVREGVTCQIAGKPAHVVTFAGTQQRDDYLKIAQSFGGNYVVGDLYLIMVASPDAASTIAKQLGATTA